MEPKMTVLIAEMTTVHCEWCRMAPLDCGSWLRLNVMILFLARSTTPANSKEKRTWGKEKWDRGAGGEVFRPPPWELCTCSPKAPLFSSFTCTAHLHSSLWYFCLPLPSLSLNCLFTFACLRLYYVSCHLSPFSPFSSHVLLPFFSNPLTSLCPPPGFRLLPQDSCHAGQVQCSVCWWQAS